MRNYYKSFSIIIYHGLVLLPIFSYFILFYFLQILAILSSAQQYNTTIFVLCSGTNEFLLLDRLFVCKINIFFNLFNNKFSLTKKKLFKNYFSVCRRNPKVFRNFTWNKIKCNEKNECLELIQRPKNKKERRIPKTRVRNMFLKV